MQSITMRASARFEMLIAPLLASALLVLAFAFVTFAKAQNAWSDMAGSAEVRALVGGKVIDDGLFIQYFREDGNSAFYSGGPYKSMSVRKWTLKEDGRLCVAPFSTPNRIIECYTFQRTSGRSPKYRYKSISGFHPFTIVDKIPASLANAVNKKGGAVQ